MVSFAILAGAVALLATSVRAQADSCEYQYGDPFFCNYCGAQGSAPVRCFAWNSTFDNLAVGATNFQDNSANFTGFTVAQPSVRNPRMNTFSKGKYAYAASGVASFSPGAYGEYQQSFFQWGYLRNFHFGCSQQGSQLPQACTVQVTASKCMNVSNGEQAQNYGYTGQPMAFRPSMRSRSNLTYADWTPNVSAEQARLAEQDPNGSYQPEWCGSYTFTAKNDTGHAAPLYIDSLIFTGYYSFQE